MAVNYAVVAPDVFVVFGEPKRSVGAGGAEAEAERLRAELERLRGERGA